MSILIQRPSETIELKLPELTYIYRFCSPTGKSYVGQTENIPHRISQHLDGEGSKSLLRDLVEYGRKAFTIEILEVLSTDDPKLWRVWRIRTLIALTAFILSATTNAPTASLHLTGNQSISPTSRSQLSMCSKPGANSASLSVRQASIAPTKLYATRVLCLV